MANAIPSSLDPESTLQRLAPHHNGEWDIAGQANDHSSLAYLMNEGSDAVAYHMVPCKTEEEVLENCGHLMYSFSDCSDEVKPPRRTEKHIRPLQISLLTGDQGLPHQVNVIQDAAGILYNYDPAQREWKGDIQPNMTTLPPTLGRGPVSITDIAYQFTFPHADSVQLPSSVPHDQSSNDSFDWTMTDGFLDTPSAMVGDLGNDNFDPILESNHMLDPIFQDFSTISDSVTLGNGDNRNNGHWNTFHEN